MMKLFTIAGAALGGWLGWDIGLLEGTTIAFIISSIGSIAGVVAGWWIVWRYLE